MRFVFVAAVIALGLVLLANQGAPEAERQAIKQATAQTVVPSEVTAHADAIRSVKLTLKAVTTSNAGTVLASFSVQNPNPIAVKDLEVSCDAKGQSGTAIRSIKRTIYQKVPAKSTKNLGQIDLGWLPTQTSAITCWLLDATIAQ